ncbi:hypothetical protein [Oryzisolibacter sp. LB2S]|uniref:hypothetical protein n=1 Tax=Alicycliphilus soli TaxID=3228789 RepID=UPI00345AE5F8
MDVLDHHGLKAVFFVDPMPELIWGVAAIEDVVRPIVARGHDVQLHLHTEWLSLAGSRNPLGERVGNNMRDFTVDEQCALLDYAKNVLVSAGAPEPVAFRAGSYGANDDTLRSLSMLGMRYDSSHCPGIASSLCDIGLSSDIQAPVEHCGVIEVPIGCISDGVNRLRHAQVTALSSAEMLSALRHARDKGMDCFTMVSHSFELMSRDRSRINKIVRRRFEKICAGLAQMSGVETGGYISHPPRVASRRESIAVPPASSLRKGLRIVEQGVANLFYGYR